MINFTPVHNLDFSVKTICYNEFSQREIEKLISKFSSRDFGKFINSKFCFKMRL